MAPARQPFNFDKDEKVFCFHGAMLYEAKIMNLEPVDPKDKKGAYKYRVHYKGWKNTWDDWVTEDRLRKFDEEGKELAATINRELSATYASHSAPTKSKSALTAQAKRKSGKSSELGSVRDSEEPKTAQATAQARGTKRGRDWEIEKEDTFTSRPSIRIPLPDHLKGLLVDDWENITKSLQLVPLPHPHPVSDILAAYAASEESKRRPGSADSDILDEVIQGIREYFDKSLGRILLYRFERQQWLEVHGQMTAAPGTVPKQTDGAVTDTDDIAHTIVGKTPSEIYGAEHLCRLFVSMPELIAQTNMDAQSVNRLREELAKMTQWLGKNVDTYFAKEYMNAGQEYTAKASGAN